MKNRGNIFILCGIIGLLLKWFVSPYLISLFPKVGFLIHVMLSLSPLLIVAGLVLQLPTKTSTSELINPENAILNGSYTTWRNANIAGIIFWFPMWFSTIMLVGGAGMTIGTIFTVIFHILALPISIFALIVARTKKISDVKKAVYFLKVPFYYGLIGICISIFVDTIF